MVCLNLREKGNQTGYGLMEIYDFFGFILECRACMESIDILGLHLAEGSI